MTRLAHSLLWCVLSSLGCDAHSDREARNLSSDSGPGPSFLDASSETNGELSANSRADASTVLLDGAPGMEGGSPMLATRLGEALDVLSNVELRSIDAELDRMRFAAVVVGLRAVEVLEEQAGALVAHEVASYDVPDVRVRSAPLFVWPLDVDCDGLLDLAFGGLRDEYVVRGSADGGFGEREPWDRYLPPQIGTGPLDYRVTADDAAWIVPYTTAKSLRAYARPTSSCQWRASADFPVTVAPVANSFAVSWPSAADTRRILVQSRGPEDDSLQLKVSAPAVDALVEGPVKPLPTAPYVASFESISSPVPLPSDARCPYRFLGVGRAQPGLSERAKSELTRVQLFSLTGQSYVWQDLPETSGVVAYGVVTRTAEGDALVGVIRRLTNRGHGFFLLRQRGCAEAELLAQLPIEFDWRTPRAPLFGQLEAEQGIQGARAGFVPPRDHPALLAAKALASDSGQRVLFAHYDGYDGRLIEAREGAGAWSLSFHKTNIHEDRNDLSFPFTESDVRAAQQLCAGDAGAVDAGLL